MSQDAVFVDTITSLVTKPSHAREVLRQQGKHNKAQNITGAKLIDMPCRVRFKRSENQFAAWLAENIRSTRLNDESSNLALLYPRTTGALRLKELEDKAQGVAHHQGYAAALDWLEAQIQQERRHQEVFNHKGAWDHLILQRWQWSVFGNSRDYTQGATPEGYWKLEARKIRASGGIPVAAGAEGKTPPVSLLQSFGTLANIPALAMIRRYERESGKSVLPEESATPDA